MTFSWRYSQHLRTVEDKFSWPQPSHAPNAKKEAEDIRLLLLVQLADVLVGSHLAGCKDAKSVLAPHGDTSRHPIPNPSFSRRSVTTSVSQQQKDIV